MTSADITIALVSAVAGGWISWFGLAHVLTPRITAAGHVRARVDERMREEPRVRYTVRVLNKSWKRAAVDVTVRPILRLPYDPSQPTRAALVSIPAQHESLMILPGGRAHIFGLSTHEIAKDDWLFLPETMQKELEEGRRLRLQDLLELEDGRATLLLYVAAYDRFSGARRVYKAAQYTRKDVKQDAFPPTRTWLRRLINDE